MYRQAAKERNEPITRTDKFGGQLLAGVDEVGQVEIDPGTLLGQRDPIHHRLHGTITQDPDADRSAIKFLCRFEDFFARTGIIQVDTHHRPGFVVEIGRDLSVRLGQIGLVFGRELFSGKAAAIAHLPVKDR